MSQWRLWRSRVGALGLLILGSSLGLPQSSLADEHGRGDLVLNEDQVCTRCHDEYEFYPILSIGRSGHGVRADERSPSCTSCHGESRDHLEGRTEDGGRPKTDVLFGADSPTPARERSAVCLDCHQGGKNLHWQMGPHAANDLACTSCHQSHTGKDAVLNPVTQPRVCADCHPRQRQAMNRFYTHPSEEGQVVCSDCHNSHGTLDADSLARDSLVDTCYQCHAEKRGPFVWSHEPVNEDCSYCHDSHGSNIAGMLSYRSPMLCQNCHEGDAHRGLPPGEFSPFTTGRGCVDCHTNIHGSNSSSGSLGARSLRN